MYFMNKNLKKYFLKKWNFMQKLKYGFVFNKYGVF